MAKDDKIKEPTSSIKDSLKEVSECTDRKKRLWLKGKAEDLEVYRIPIKFLYFNIENGRYADKMIQLRVDNPGVNIDARQDKWKREIHDMLLGRYKGSTQGPGTEEDRIAFDRLLEDIRNRTQLEPGVVLADGGVIDGNRRLAVLLTLFTDPKEKNSEKWAYFDGVILPEDVSAEDRWRIEAGTQLGRDQQLDYSPINKLLKIREGYYLFKSSKLPKGKSPEDLVADTLYGIPRNEILYEINRINLIDEYLNFFGVNGQYHLVSGKSEEFKEALNNIIAARNSGFSPEELSKWKALQFQIIHENLMNNWELREFKKALGGDPKARGKKPKSVKKAVEYIKKNAPDPKVLRKSYVKGRQKDHIERTKFTVNQFRLLMEAADKESKPLDLATDSRVKLETLRDILKDAPEKPENLRSITTELNQSKSLASECIGILEK